MGREAVLAAAVVEMLVLYAATSANAADRRPNIVFILSDNLGYGEAETDVVVPLPRVGGLHRRYEGRLHEVLTRHCCN